MELEFIRNLELMLTDKNALKRGFKILSTSINAQEKLEEEMKTINNELNIMGLTEENMNVRKNLCIRLGKLMYIFRENKIHISYIKQRLLKEANLTG